MKTVLLLFGALLILTGVIWMLQGANLIPPGNPLARSFMMGQIEWLIIGIFTAIGGAAMVYFGRRPTQSQ